jgi:hypothetical protein
VVDDVGGNVGEEEEERGMGRGMGKEGFGVVEGNMVGEMQIDEKMETRQKMVAEQQRAARKEPKLTASSPSSPKETPLHDLDASMTRSLPPYPLSFSG